MLVEVFHFFAVFSANLLQPPSIEFTRSGSIDCAELFTKCSCAATGRSVAWKQHQHRFIGHRERLPGLSKTLLLHLTHANNKRRNQIQNVLTQAMPLFADFTVLRLGASDLAHALNLATLFKTMKKSKPYINRIGWKSSSCFTSLRSRQLSFLVLSMTS